MKEKTDELIPKKLVAIELYKVHKRVQNLSILTILGSLIGASIMKISSIGGAIVVGLVAATASYFLVTSRKEMIYLNEKYSLGVKMMKPKDIQTKTAK